MMKFDIRNDKIDLADEMEEDFRKTAKEALTDAAKILLAESHAQIERFGKNGPAPEGETPATFTGNLKKLPKRLPTRQRSRSSRHVSSGVIYAPHAHLLEYGHINANGSRTMPRPFIEIANRNAEPEIEATLNKLIE
jgi:hypothetical protein